MKFIVRDNEGQEYGPVDQETLEKWASNGQVLPGMEIRNSLMNQGKPAEEFDFLQVHFKQQKEDFEKNAGFFQKLKKKKQEKRKEEKERQENSIDTSFKYTYLPNPASIFLRTASFVFDLVLLGAFALLWFLIGVLCVYAGMPVDGAFTFFVIMFVAISLLYYGIALGVYAQTFGMWFWGIFIVRFDYSEIYLLRAYLYTLCMLVTGIASPFVVFAHPSRRSLHDIITGARVIRIAARPKA